jgi:hypothetical protein
MAKETLSKPKSLPVLQDLKPKVVCTFKASSYACRNCFTLTQKVYAVGKDRVIACCADCATKSKEKKWNLNNS